jgi:hypothetical protein
MKGAQRLRFIALEIVCGAALLGGIIGVAVHGSYLHRPGPTSLFPHFHDVWLAAFTATFGGLALWDVSALRVAVNSAALPALPACCRRSAPPPAWRAAAWWALASAAALSIGIADSAG